MGEQRLALNLLLIWHRWSYARSAKAVKRAITPSKATGTKVTRGGGQSESCGSVSVGVRHAVATVFLATLKAKWNSRWIHSWKRDRERESETERETHTHTHWLFLFIKFSSRELPACITPTQERERAGEGVASWESALLATTCAALKRRERKESKPERERESEG